MLVMTVKTMLGLRKLMPHQTMLRKKLLIPYNRQRMAGRILFISHQWTGHADADATGLQLRTLQGMVTRLMRGEIAKVETNWKQQLFAKDNDIVTAKQWKAALPHMYVWMDYASIPQPTAGDLSADLIPQEISRRGSFFGSFRKTASFQEPAATDSACDTAEVKETANAAVEVGHGGVGMGHAGELEHSKTTNEGKGEAVPTANATLRDAEGNCVTCGLPESSSTSDHRQITSTTPEWKKHVQMWLGKAVQSIPAYIERSTIVLVLVPPVEHVDRQGELCDYGNWRRRGWCRLELAGAALARSRIRIMLVKAAVAQVRSVYSSTSENVR